MQDVFEPFKMERLMSKWENLVEYNLSESGVHPLTLKGLLGEDYDCNTILDIELNYPQANGIEELRERIAALYPGAGKENILVTVGAIEANFLALETLLSPGDRIAAMEPNYTQIWGLARNMNLEYCPFSLREEKEWGLDLEKGIDGKTKLIAVCNPNNPTGHILSEDEMNAIVAAAEECGAWILADEVYVGAERIQHEVTPSFYGRGSKVLAVGSLSKAYGIPGLRLGWVVGPEDVIDQFWARHEYLTISATMLSNHLAALALKPEVRTRLINRVRSYIKRGYSILEEWVTEHNELFSMVPPQATAVAFIRSHLKIPSEMFVQELIKRKSTLIIPGAHFGVEHHYRISYGQEPDFLRAGLDRISQLARELS